MTAPGSAAPPAKPSPPPCPVSATSCEDGQREPVRVRAAYVTDNDLHDMGRDYPRQPSHLAPPHRQSPEVIDLPATRRARDRQLAAI